MASAGRPKRAMAYARLLNTSGDISTVVTGRARRARTAAARTSSRGHSRAHSRPSSGLATPTKAPPRKRKRASRTRSRMVRKRARGIRRKARERSTDLFGSTPGEPDPAWLVAPEPASLAGLGLDFGSDSSDLSADSTEADALERQLNAIFGAQDRASPMLVSPPPTSRSTPTVAPTPATPASPASRASPPPQTSYWVAYASEYSYSSEDDPRTSEHQDALTPPAASASAIATLGTTTAPADPAVIASISQIIAHNHVGAPIALWRLQQRQRLAGDPTVADSGPPTPITPIAPVLACPVSKARFIHVPRVIGTGRTADMLCGVAPPRRPYHGLEVATATQHGYRVLPRHRQWQYVAREHRQCALDVVRRAWRRAPDLRYTVICVGDGHGSRGAARHFSKALMNGMAKLIDVYHRKGGDWGDPELHQRAATSMEQLVAQHQERYSGGGGASVACAAVINNRWVVTTHVGCARILLLRETRDTHAVQIVHATRDHAPWHWDHLFRVLRYARLDVSEAGEEAALPRDVAAWTADPDAPLPPASPAASVPASAPTSAPAYPQNGVFTAIQGARTLLSDGTVIPTAASVGDTAAHAAGAVTATPTTTVVACDPTASHILIAASDGVWGHITEADHSADAQNAWMAAFVAAKRAEGMRAHQIAALLVERWYDEAYNMNGVEMDDAACGVLVFPNNLQGTPEADARAQRQAKQGGRRSKRTDAGGRRKRQRNT